MKDERDFNAAEVMLEGIVWALGGEVRVSGKKFQETPQNHEVRFTRDPATDEIVARLVPIAATDVPREGRA